MKRYFNTLFLLLLSVLFRAQLSTDVLTYKLDSVLAGYDDKEPGASIYIQQGNQTLYSKSFGLADLKSKEQFSDLTVSNIGGISKTFISYSILILQQQGKLSINDAVTKYLTGFISPEIAEKITIKQLLMHTSGFMDEPLSKKDSVHYFKITDEQNFETLKKNNKPVSLSGSNYSYSDKTYSGLVLIVEKVSKLKFEEFVKQYILTPSGMTFTKITNGVYPESAVAHAYIKSGKKNKEYDNGECPKMETISSAGIWSNVVDLRKYVYALNYNLFLDSMSTKLSLKYFPSVTGSSVSHGLCWFGNNPENKKEDTFIEYSAKQCGFCSHLIFYPEKELTVIYLSNNGKDLTDKLVHQLKHLKFIK